MKIGILTVPFNNNYGGYLQSYALMTVLKQMGHEPTIIMRRHQRPIVSTVGRVKYLAKGIVKSILHRKHYPLLYDVENVFKQKGKNMHIFLNTHIQPQTEYVYTTEDLQTICKDRFDAYIVGSDQVWRAIYVPGIIGNMYLDFTKEWDVKRIAYAASFGTDMPEYTSDEIKLCGELIKCFDAVSVRESSGLDVFKKFKWQVNNPQVVLDPTFLLSKDEYNEILPQSNDFAKGKIFCYVLDKSDEAKNAIDRIQDEVGKPIYEIADIQKGDSVLPSVETWLTAIRDSDFVITDSFHGTVFSIIFNKPFVVYANEGRGKSRFEAILGQSGLMKNIYTENSSIEQLFNIDWTTVNRIIKAKSSESKKFIVNSLIV